MTTIQAVLDEDDGMNAPGVVKLHNMVTVAKTGIGRRLTKLSDEKMDRVSDATGCCLGCEDA
jgi:mRNA-degrading endonuclease toxin of MazEF toxin-antitoxin module